MRDYNRVREKEAAGSIPDTQKGAKNRPTSIQECPVHISDCSCSNCFPLLKPLIPSSITWHPATHQMLSWKDLKPFNKMSTSSLSIISKLFGIIHFALTTFLRHMFFPFFACSFSSANFYWARMPGYYAQNHAEIRHSSYPGDLTVLGQGNVGEKKVREK